MKVLIRDVEAFPVLEVDDCSWRGDPMGSEPPGHYPEERPVEIPDALLDYREGALQALRAVEKQIRALADEQAPGR